MRHMHLPLLAVLLLAVGAAAGPISAQPGIDVALAESAEFDFPGPPPIGLVPGPFTAREVTTIRGVVAEVEEAARELLPGLPDRIRVTVARVDRELSSVGGVSGRADAPGEILIEMSASSEGGLADRTPGLRHALYHELHHLARGWTIRENRFGPGISIAAVNEGLAEVFAEERTGRVLPASEYPEDVEHWAREIRALPTDADYGAWMFSHPDGRLAIGYRTGRYLVHRAMEISGMTVLELSALSPEAIWKLAAVDGSGRASGAPQGSGFDG